MRKTRRVGRFGTVLGVAATSAVLASCSLFGSDSNDDAGNNPRSTGSNGQPVPGVTGGDKAPATVSVAGSGDILIHAPVHRNAALYAKEEGKSGYDFDPMFAQVKPVISAADIAICQQETPVSKDNSDVSQGRGGLVYNAPREIVKDLKDAGFDGCGFSSNHILDRGVKGIDTTREVFEEDGLKLAGATTDPNDPGMPAIYEANGVKVANLAYTYTLPNQGAPNTDVPSSAPYLERYLWPKVGSAGIIADAKKAKEAGADLVIVNMHWGNEYQEKPTEDQLRVGKELLASSDIDAVWGAHAHVIQPCSTINGKTIWYGTGNFLSNQGPGQASILGPRNADGIIAQVTFTRDKGGKWTQKASYQPTYVDIPKRHTIELATPTLNPDSYQRTTTTIASLGDCDAKPMDGG